MKKLAHSLYNSVPVDAATRETEAYEPIELAEQALGTAFFYDAERSNLARTEPESLAEYELEERQLAYWASLRRLAALRADERNANDDPFDGHVWEPTNNQWETLRFQLSPYAERVRLINNLEAYITGYQQGEFDTLARPHQQDAMDNLLAFTRARALDTTPKHPLTKGGYMDLPTAYGKTFIMTELVRAYAERDNDYEITATPKTLVLVPRKLLVDQTIGADGKRGFGKFTPDISATPYYSEVKDLSGDVVVMTYHSFNNLMKHGALAPDAFDILICDEAHHGLGHLTKKHLEEYRQDKLAIGLTASSEYSEERKVEHLLPYLIHQSDLRTSIEAGILAGVQCWSYKTDASFVVESTQSKDYTNAELLPLAENAARNEHAVKFAAAFVEKGLQGVAACIPGGGCAHAIKLAEMMSETQVRDPETGKLRHIRAAAVGNFLEDDEREEILRKYDEGGIDVLTFVKMIGEGWDSENAKFLLSLCPTRSPVRSIQRLGRVLRPNEQEQYAQVVEFLDTAEGEPKPQYTFMHALGEEVFYQGGLHSKERDQPSSHLLLQLNDLPAELQQRLAQIDAIPVDELIVMPKQHDPPPEGWLSVAALTELMTEMHPQSIRKFLLQNGFEGRIARGKINTPTYYFSPEAAEYLQNNPQLDKAPEGWMTQAMLVKEFGVSQRFVERIIAALELAGVTCRHRNTGQILTHYNPEEIEQLRAKFDAIEVAQPDEHLPRHIARQLGISDTLVRRCFRERGIQGTIKRTREGGPFGFFYTAEQAEQAREWLQPPGLAPEGWMTTYGIARAADVSMERVQNYLRSKFPDEQGELLRGEAPDGRKTSGHRFFDPEVVQTALDDLKPDKIPEDAQPLRDVCTHYKATPATIQRILGEHGASTQLLTPKGSKARHYVDAAGMAILATELGAIQPAQTGWLTGGEIARHAGVSYTLVRKELQELPDPGGRLMRMDNQSGNIVMHYPPDISAQIIAQCQPDTIFPDWPTMNNLTERFRFSRTTIEKTLQLYHVPYLRVRRRKQGRVNIYPPDVVATLDALFKSIPDAPLGWLNTSEIATAAGCSFITAKRLLKEQSDIATVQARTTGAQRIIAQFYPPEGLVHVKAQLETPELPPDWRLLGDIAAEVDEAPNKLRALFDRSGIAGMAARNSSNMPTTAYPPEAADKARAYYRDIPTAPNGALTVHGICQALSITRAAAERYLRDTGQLDAATPMRSPDTRRVQDYYSAQIVAGIRQEFRQHEVPEGWVSLTDAAAALQVGYAAILELLRKQHYPLPSLRTDGGTRRIYLPPGALALAHEAFAVSEAEDGWYNARELAGMFGKSRDTVVKHIGQLDVGPGQSRRMRTRTGKRRPVVHYSPEVVAGLRARYQS